MGFWEIKKYFSGWMAVQESKGFALSVHTPIKGGQGHNS